MNSERPPLHETVLFLTGLTTVLLALIGIIYVQIK